MKKEIKILHLEDIQADAELVARELKKGNIQFNMLVVDNRIDFEEALIEFHPDLILADHTLPSFNSLEAIKIIKQKGIKIPIILVTATASDEYAVEIMKAGADDYILKENLHRLSKAVVNAMEKEIVKRQLQESEIFNKGILSSLSSHIAVINSSGILVAVNKAWDDFGKVNGMTVLERTKKGSDYIEVCKKAIENGDNYAKKALEGIQSIIKKEKQYFEMDYPCYSPTEELWFTLNVSPFGEDDSKVVISHHNITQLKIAESKLNNTSNELNKALAENNKILDSSLDIICTINGEGEFVNVNAASQLVLGYSPKELIGRNIINLLYPKDVAITMDAVERITKNIQIPIFENRYKHKDGSVISLLWSVNWDEKLQLAFCTAKDVTQNKKLEKAKKDERDQFYNMFLKAPSAIGMLKGANHVFEMVNPLYLQLIGKKDVIGKTAAEILPEVIEQGFIEILDNVYHTGESYTGKEMLVKVDLEDNGQLTDFYINFVYQAYKNGEGEIDGIFFFINDITEQVTFRKQIETSEKKYRQIVETAQEGIWLIDENSITTFVNKKMCEILEYTEEEILGKENFYFMDKDGKEKALAALKRRKTGIVEKLEYNFISKNGNHILTEVSANPIFDKKGIFRGALGMISDVTEKKKLERLLEKSNRLARIGSWEIDVINNTVYWSDITKEIREAEPDFLPDLSTGIGFFTEGKNKKVISKRVQRCIDHGTPWDEELQITTFKGNQKWIRTIGEADFINGKCSKIYGSFQDITERKNAAEKVKRSEAKLKIAQHIAHVGSWEVDMFTEEYNWSDEFYNILGIKKQVIPSFAAFLSYVHHDDREIGIKAWNTAIVGHADSSFNFRFSREDGEIGYATAEWRFEFDSNMVPIYTYGILRDLTKAKIAENERAKMIADIMQRNNDLEQFSYIVSHNLRSPVANIIGLTEELSDDSHSAETKLMLSEALSFDIKQLENVTADLNTILQTKRDISERKEYVNLSELVQNIKLSINELIQQHHVSIKVDFTEIDEILTIKSYIQSIFYNFITNSIKYRRLDINSVIEIQSHIVQDKLLIVFKDNGSGINLIKNGEQIFDLYKRFHKNIEGKGMGLYMVKMQVETLGGKISVKSEVNKGAEFKIEFENYE